MKIGTGNNYPDIFGHQSRLSRSLHIKPLSRSVHGSSSSLAGHNRKNRQRKPADSQKKDSNFYKTNLNHTDYAYREAVNKLKSMLADSYNAVKQSTQRLGYESDDTDNVSVIGRPTLSEISKYIPSSGLTRYNSGKSFYGPNSPYGTAAQQNNLKKDSVTSFQPISQYQATIAPPVPKTNGDLLQFIEKQEGYIEQLERESQYCRGELNNVLNKVKDVISENEALTERTKLATITSDTSDSGSNDFNFKIPSKERHEIVQLSGPNIVFESRISELEAQLAQAEIDIKKLTHENNQNKQKLANGEGIRDDESATSEVYKRQIEMLQREKKELEESGRKLQSIVDSLKAADAQNFSDSLRSRDIAEQSAFEKAQSDIEIRRLRDELDRQHARVREMSKKIAEERSLAERRYNYQVDQLGGDLSSQWEIASRLQLELERQKRTEADYRRDLAQKNSQIEDLRSELNQKTASLLSEMAQVNAEKQSIEQELTSLRLQLERAERQSKVESSKLNAEIVSLRQRLDRADSDLLISKRENLRFGDEIAALEKEITLGDLNRETRPSKELAKLMSDMEAKHVATVTELEGMVQDQKQLMEKLTAECKTLTNKLEDTTLKHKHEMNILHSNIDYLSNKFEKNDTEKIPEQESLKYEHAINENRASITKATESYELDTAQNTKPVVGTNGRSSQPQSRRGSLYDSQRRLSQQSTSGQLVENQLSSNIPLEADDKYLQDSFETEKSRPFRISPNAESDQSQSNGSRRRSSLRFYEENLSVGKISKQIADPTDYTELGYEQSIQQYIQSDQNQTQPQQLQEDHAYHEYKNQAQYDEPNSIYKTEDYDTTQYVNQPIYEGNPYRTDALHTPNDYNFHGGYQEYEAANFEQSGYQPNEQSSDALYLPEQYSGELYHEEIKTIPDLGKNQSVAQPSYTESSKMGQTYKGSANSSNIATHRQQSMSKQKKTT